MGIEAICDREFMGLQAGCDREFMGLEAICDRETMGFEAACVHGVRLQHQTGRGYREHPVLSRELVGLEVVCDRELMALECSTELVECASSIPYCIREFMELEAVRDGEFVGLKEVYDKEFIGLEAYATPQHETVLTVCATPIPSHPCKECLPGR